MHAKCYYCNKELTERTIKRHMKSCSEMHKIINSELEKKLSEVTNQFLISIKYKYSNDYCIYVSINENLQLKHLDDFIRDIWVECCNHLSCFTINNTIYNDNRSKEYEMNVLLKDILEVGMKFDYMYDYGSSTELKLEVVDTITVSKTHSEIEIIARNNSNTSNKVDSPRDNVCGYIGSKENEKKYLPGNKSKFKINENLALISHNKQDDDFDNNMIDGMLDELGFDSDPELKRDFAKYLKESEKYDRESELSGNNVLEDLACRVQNHISKTVENYMYDLHKKFIRGKKSFDLEEVIYSLSKDKIEVCAMNNRFYIPKKLKKKEYAKAFIDKYEDLMESYLDKIDKDRLSYLSQCYKNGGIIEYNQDDLAKCLYFNDYGIIFPAVINNKYVFLMPKVMQSLVKKHDTFAFKKQVNCNTEIINVFRGMIKCYGALYFEDIIKIMKRYIKDIDSNKVLNTLIFSEDYYIDEYYMDSVNNKRVFVCMSLSESEGIINSDLKTEYANISKEKLLSMSSKDYLEESEIGREFLDEMQSLFVIDDIEAIESMKMMALDIQQRSNKEIIDSVLEGINENLEIEDKIIVTDMVNNLIKNIPLWRYKGFTLNQLEKNRKGNHIGRNDLCPCGSGKKYKKCCGKNNKVINLF